jgi:adenylate cyclase
MFSVLRRFRQSSVRRILTPQHPLRRLTFGLVVGVAVAALLSLGLWVDLFSGIRTYLTDRLYRPRPTTGIVTIVAIDDASLAAYGRSTVDWPRSVHAQLINTLKADGARVIAFDVLFADPTSDDPTLAAAMKDAGNVVQPIVGTNVGSRPTTPRGQLITYDTFLGPTPALADASKGLGHANIVPDQDGQVRRVPLFVLQDGKPVPALALEAYMQYLHYPAQAVQIERDVVQVANRHLYTDDNDRMLIYYFGPPSRVNQPATSSFPAYSFVDVVNGKVPPDAFKGKIVLVGALDASGLPDSYATPGSSTGEKMFGVEIHANIIETIHQSLATVPEIHNNVNWRLSLGPLHLQLYRGTAKLPLREQPLNEQIAITFLLAIGAGLVLPFLRWYFGFVLVAVTYVVYFFWASASFTVLGRVVDLLFPAFGLGFTYLGTVIVSYVFEERRRNQINDLFSRYVSAEIAQKIVEVFDQGKLELGGEEREITVLFADVRGFTTLSESLTPPEVVGMLNVFLEQMTDIVMQNGGAINKYIGDNLMAFWNAPYPQPDHAWLATKAGMEMLEAVHKLNETRHFSAPVQFGIGINTGPVVVGNVGSSRRLEYTPIGDTVNTASRLCGVAPGGSVYIGVRTREQVGDRVTPVAEYHIKVKGKAEPVEVYELRPDGSQPPPPLSDEH